MEESKAKRDVASWEAEQAEQESWLESFDAGRGNESVGAESPGADAEMDVDADVLRRRAVGAHALLRLGCTCNLQPCLFMRFTIARRSHRSKLIPALL